MSLKDKAVLVTGAAARLGAQIARTLHQNGANLIIHYRASAAAAETLAAELNRLRPASATTLCADLADPAAVERLAAKACAAFDGLVASNYRAPLFLSQACYPALRERQGGIINLVDIYAERPLAGHSVYASAKAANAMLIKTLALELAPEVRVNGIAPGAILWPGEAVSEEYRQSILGRVPLQRTGEARDIADAALFLATSRYITGEIIHVDGGRLLQ